MGASQQFSFLSLRFTCSRFLVLSTCHTRSFFLNYVFKLMSLFYFLGFRLSFS